MYDQKLAFWRVLFMVPKNKLTKLLESNFMQGYKFAFFRPVIAGPKNSIVLRLCGHDILHFVFLQD